MIRTKDGRVAFDPKDDWIVDEVNRLSANLDVVKQNYVHACESIENKDRIIEDRDVEIKNLRQAIRRYGLEICQASNGWTLHDVSDLAVLEEEKTAVVISRNIDLEIENERLKKDESRLKYLAGCGSDDGPIIEGFANVLDDYWSFLGDAIRKRIGDENDSPEVEGTDEDKLEAFRSLVDASMAEEKRKNERRKES